MSSPHGLRRQAHTSAAYRIVLTTLLVAATTASAYGTTLQNLHTEANVDWTSAGVGGVSNTGSGSINLTGVNGPVKKAFLYWHGIDLKAAGGDGFYDNDVVSINGNQVQGASLGDATTNCWPAVDSGLEAGSSRAFRADVTQFVNGNGAYNITGLSAKPGHSGNGASLVVIFDDGNDTNNRDLVFFEGNDSNRANGFPGEDDGWNAVLSGINYQGGTVSVQLHVADGQTWPDSTLTFSGRGGPVFIFDTPTLWDGNSVSDAGASRASPICVGGDNDGLACRVDVPADCPGGLCEGNGSLWDIHTFDVTGAFGSPGPSTLTMSGQLLNGDCLGLVLLLMDLKAGSAPPTPTFSPTNTPTVTGTPTETSTSTPTNTPTPTATATPTNTQTPSETATSSPTVTQTTTPTNTATVTQTNSPTWTPTQTPTPTENPTTVQATGTCREPGPTGLVPCALGTIVTAFLCNDASCSALIQLGMTTVNDQTGDFSFVLDRSQVAGKRLIFDATIAPPASASARAGRAAAQPPTDYRIIDFGPVGAVAPIMDVDIGPVSEAAVQLLSEQGLQHYTNQQIQDAMQAVQAANPDPAAFAGASPAAAVMTATDAARNDPTAQAAIQTCAGDCSKRASVTIDEILTLANIELGNAAVVACTAGDGNGDGKISVDEILAAVTNALNGCGPPMLRAAAFSSQP